ncbi:MAG: gamma-glutamyl-gamma-aminobutyrate hydrolase family protein [Verrucomicrobiae bacterium]|nr:gamma-glutamyl-gamma-aminobutyrate hydrolase family protein [Verrucomicrobiae bacterium]
MADRPIIAITGTDGSFPIAWWAAKLAILIAGGTAVRLTPSNFRNHEKERFKAVIIGGGSDIDAELYGGENTGRSRIDPARDLFEIEMIRHALDTHLPILGICRGAQLINVVLGGSLFADIRPLRRRTSNRRTPLPRKTAVAESNGLLVDAIECERWRINSLHHQAIDRLGEGLRVAARDLDSFVQAVESASHPWLVGVQWHPEYLIYIKRQRMIFAHLVRRAGKSAAEALILDRGK